MCGHWKVALKRGRRLSNTTEHGKDYLLHCCANRLTHGNSTRIEVFQAMHIDAKSIRRDALAMKGINAADFAEKMPRRLGVKLIFGEKLSA